MIQATSGYGGYQWFLNGSALGTQNDFIYASQPGIYSVQVTDSLSCTAADSIAFMVSVPQVTLGNDTSVCNVDSVLMQATSGYSSYQWFVNGSPMASQNDFIYATQQGAYVVQVTDSIGCTDADTVQVVFGAVAISLPSDTAICSGESYTINGPAGFSSYQWLNNNIVIGTNESITVTQSGQYILLVSDATGCNGTDSIAVTVYQLPVLQVTNDTTICTGYSIQLNASGAQSFSWSPSTYLSSDTIPNPVASPVDPITYTVTGISPDGCSATEIISISLTDVPEAAFTYNLDYDCNGILMATANVSSNATSYLWDFGDSQTSTEISPLHYYDELKNQSVQLVAFNSGCSDTIVQSNITFSIPELNIPNVFTPGEDGKNDCFQIPDSENLAGCLEIKIFSRWGKEVYQSSGSDCWYGRSNGGETLPAAVYFYIIKLGDQEFHGSVQLIR